MGGYNDPFSGYFDNPLTQALGKLPGLFERVAGSLPAVGNPGYAVPFQPPLPHFSVGDTVTAPAPSGSAPLPPRLPSAPNQSFQPGKDQSFPGDSGYLVSPQPPPSWLPPGWKPPAGEAVPASTEPSGGSGQIRRGPNGEILLTNIPGAGRELEMGDTGRLPAQRQTFEDPFAPSGQVNLDVGRLGRNGLPVAGGYLEAAPDPTEATWEEVKRGGYSPLQQEHWLEDTLGSEIPTEKAFADIGEAKARTALAGAQGGLFGAQAEAQKAAAAAARDPLRAVPFVDARLHIEANQARYQPILQPIALDIMRRDLEQRGVIKPGQPVPDAMWQQLPPQALEYYRQKAIDEFLRGSSPQVAVAQERSGFGT